MIAKNLGAVRNFIPNRSRIVFVPTAGNVYENPTFVYDDFSKLQSAGYRLTNIDLSQISASQLRQAIDQNDAIYVAGGNSFYLLDELKKFGHDKIIIDAVNREIPYVGASAGAAILGPSIAPMQFLDDALKAPDLRNYDGLNLIDFVPMPHFGTEKYSAQYDKLAKNYTGKFNFEPLPNDQAIVIDGENPPQKIDSAVTI